MSTHNLQSFITPASIVLVGASRRPDSVGGVASRNLAAFPGRVLRVNRHLRPDHERGIYADLSELTEAPELAVVAIRASGVPEVIGQLARLGTRAAVVLSAGFAETSACKEGKALEQAMLAEARATGLRILGPDCVGVLAPGAQLNAGCTRRLPTRGRVAFVSQSRELLTSVIDWADEKGFGFSCLVSLGDMSDVDAADWLDFLASDPATRAILGHLESVENARKFMSAARQAARVKPLIVLKGKRSPASAKAVASHIGGLAGRDEAFDAALHRAGALRVSTLMQMFGAAEALAHDLRLQRGRFTIPTRPDLGAPAADQPVADSGKLAGRVPAEVAELDAMLAWGWSHGNSLDMSNDADAECALDMTAEVLESAAADELTVINHPTGSGDPLPAAEAVAAAVLERPKHEPALAARTASGAGREAAPRIESTGSPSFETPAAIIRGFMQLAERRRQLEFLSRTVPAFPLRGRQDRAAVREIIHRVLARGDAWLDGVAAKDLLEIAGFPVNVTRRAKTPAEARRIAGTITPPYTIKILSRDLLHKNDAGGVALNVETAEEVGRVAERMIRRLHARHPDARPAGVSVEQMVDCAEGAELIAGLSLDPVFGPVVLFGAGGGAVEAIDDTALALPPLDVNLARDLVERTRVHRVLQGAGGRLRPVAFECLYDVLIRLSELSCEFPEITYLDLDPVIATPGGVTIADARIRLERTTRGAVDRLAIVPYPRELETPFILPGVGRCLLRPIRAEDEVPMQRAFKKLSVRSRYLRLGAAVSELRHERAARLTQIDYDREMAFVIAEDKSPGEAELYGGVRVVSDANHEKGEFAITVLDEFAGRGVGRRLMRVLLDYSGKKGLREIYGVILRENEPMLALCRELGFTVHMRTDDPTTVETRLRLS